MKRRTPDWLPECYRLYEETGSIEACLRRFPELEAEIRAHASFRQKLTTLAGSMPQPSALAAGKRLLLSALAETTTSGGLQMAWSSLRGLAAPFAVVVLLGGAALGASAASGGMQALLENETPTAPETADATATLTATPGDATATATASVTVTPTSTSTPDSTSGTPTTESTPKNHGEAVSEAVHEAKENGESVGSVACEIAQSMVGKPEGAQNAPGRQGKEPNECGPNKGDDTAASGTPQPTATPSSSQQNAGPGKGQGQGNENKGKGKGR